MSSPFCTGKWSMMTGPLEYKDPFDSKWKQLGNPTCRKEITWSPTFSVELKCDK